MIMTEELERELERIVNGYNVAMAFQRTLHPEIPEEKRLTPEDFEKALEAYVAYRNS